MMHIALSAALFEIQQLRAERDAARAEAEKEEKDCLQVIAERDEHEQRLNRIFSALGMDEAESEWSSANDPAALAIEKAEELRAALLTAEAGEARAVEALKEIAVFAQGLRERSDVSTFVVIGHMIEGYLNKHAVRAAALRAGEVGDE